MVQFAPKPVTGAAVALVEMLVADALGLVGCSEGTELEVEVFPGGGTAEPWSGPAHDEPTKAMNPIAAASASRLTMVAPTRCSPAAQRGGGPGIWTNSPRRAPAHGLSPPAARPPLLPLILAYARCGVASAAPLRPRGRGFTSVITFETITGEVVGSLGMVASLPLTTGLGAVVANGGSVA